MAEPLKVLDLARHQFIEEETKKRVKQCYDTIAELRRAEAEHRNLGKKVEGLRKKIQEFGVPVDLEKLFQDPSNMPPLDAAEKAVKAADWEGAVARQKEKADLE